MTREGILVFTSHSSHDAVELASRFCRNALAEGFQRAWGNNRGIEHSTEGALETSCECDLIGFPNKRVKSATRKK